MSSGALYDAFTLERREDGSNRLVETDRALAPVRICDGDTGPDGGVCHGRPR